MNAALQVTRDVAVALCAAAGLMFFTAGTVGLLRFPDLRSRLHAVTKADTLGLGFVMLALALASDSLWAAAAFMLVWVIGIGAAAVTATLLGSGPGATPETGTRPGSGTAPPRDGGP